MTLLTGLALWLCISFASTAIICLIGWRSNCLEARRDEAFSRSCRAVNDNERSFEQRRLPAILFVLVATGLAVGIGHLKAQPLELPTLRVQGEAHPSCVDVQLEGARSLSYDCLNQELKQASQERTDSAPTANAATVVGAGAPTTVGTFSYTGTSVRMGSAFGKSATPQRPPAPSFTSALVAHAQGAR